MGTGRGGWVGLGVGVWLGMCMGGYVYGWVCVGVDRCRGG